MPTIVSKFIDQTTLQRLISILVFSLFISFIITPAWASSFAVIHTVLEIFCILIAFSSFLAIWFISKIQKINLILGFGFLGVAILDVLHTFYWQGLGFYPLGYYDLSAKYWLAGRFFEALFLILSTTSIGRSISRYKGLAFTLFLSFFIGFVFLYTPDTFPTLLTPEGVTPLKIAIEYIIISMFIWFLYRLSKGYLQEDMVTKKYLLLAILVAVPAELCFTVFTNITNFYNVLGHVLKIVYYYFFLQAVFVGYIVFPYKELQLSGERFHKVFRYSPVSKSILTIEEGQFIDVNDMWLQTTGYAREDIIGKNAKDFNLFPINVMNKSRIELISENGVLTNHKYLFQTKNGVLREGLFSTQKIMLQEEPCLLIVMIDITDQVRNENELLRLDRLNLIGQMAAGIGHEVRNPMTTVRGFLQILSEKKECIKYQDYFSMMIEELDRANSIITDFLSLSSNKPSNVQAYNLNKIIDDLFPLLQADALNADHSILWEKLPVTDLEIDRNEIHQVIINLVRNGIEAMQNGGQVTIRTFTDGDETVLAIKDEGPGIEPEILDKIGTPFFSTKEQGTGLGLATCYSIAERNNASIDVNSSSAGTTFFVRFKTVL
ncbi:MASE3 domain-containing protein [Desulfosporosinus nitroreducens]|uniref:histidine kinase n=1 Tax=Desulfosporosinus nitroreducens TaxID=2018668 RepID=A0ABT8QQ78_9FIRM|nr:MASE3 domain-containing protein [Desulfosporosinus nitroreducens]MDO0823300.1 ATP-binding protein [Desulfosporosinus nitroreducens]